MFNYSYRHHAQRLRRAPHGQRRVLVAVAAAAADNDAVRGTHDTFCAALFNIGENATYWCKPNTPVDVFVKITYALRCFFLSKQVVLVSYC